MASNERTLAFGVGEAKTVSVKVTWLSGAETVLKELPVNITVELAEGTARTRRR